MSLGLPLQYMCHSKDDVVVCFSVDETFTGIMQGAPGDEGEGCILSGQCVLHVQRPIKVSRLILFFEGQCKVHLKKANSYGMTSLSGTSETRSLYSRQQYFLGQDGDTHTLQPGVHFYQFSFDLPSHLPASFHGARGHIRYRLTCAIYRSMFSPDLRSSLDITIKRCLMSDLALFANCVETVHGTKHTDKIQYSGTATAMAYREGGQIRLNLAIQQLQPGHYSMKSITSTLRERVQYRTTDSQSRTMVARSDDLYPLGYNTFCPDQSPNYDPTRHQNYDTLLHLIPRVNADTNSRLIRVTHSMVVKIMLQQKPDSDDDDDHSEDEDNETTTENLQHRQLANGDDRYTSWATNQTNDKRQEHPLEQPRTLSAPSVLHHGITPPSNPTSPSLGQSLSSSSLKSIFSLKKKSDDNSLSPKCKTPRIQEKQRYYRNSIVLCTLEIPIVVTSRHNALEDHRLDCPPSYLQTAFEAAPGYLQTLETCPVVPAYGNDNSNNVQTAVSRLV